MESINYYDLLRKFSRNILFVIFDFLPTETVFLNLGLINKHFYSKVKDYQKIARTAELNYMNYSLSPVFPYIENLIFHMVNTFKKVVVKLPDTLVNLHFFGKSPPYLILESIPSHLQSFKHTSFETQDNLFNNIFISSLQTKTLKALKVYQNFNAEILTYLDHNRLANLEEIHLPLECNLIETMISTLLPNEKLKKIRFKNAMVAEQNCVMNGLYLLCQIKSLVNIGFPGFFLNPEYGLDKIIRALPNLQVIKFYSYATKCEITHFYKLIKYNIINMFKCALV